MPSLTNITSDGHVSNTTSSYKLSRTNDAISDQRPKDAIGAPIAGVYVVMSYNEQARLFQQLTDVLKGKIANAKSTYEKLLVLDEASLEYEKSYESDQIPRALYATVIDKIEETRQQLVSNAAKK